MFVSQSVVCRVYSDGGLSYACSNQSDERQLHVQCTMFYGMKVRKRYTLTPHNA